MTILEMLNQSRRRGVSLSALHVLLVVLDDSPLTPTDVAKRCGISTAGVTGQIDRLEKGDWVTRQRHTNDRRKFYIVPTERAFNLFLPILEAITNP